MIKYKTPIAIGLIWLFHISGIIGMSIGFEEWFITKTPLNLLISFILLLIVYPIDSWPKGYIVFIFFVAGLFVEWVGVQSGVLFGEYYYGDNLGLKMAGVPFMMGINWAMLVLATGAIANRINIHWILKALVGAALMVFLDVFIEPSAPIFDFWYWSEGHPPLENFVAWFVISFLLHVLYQRQIGEGSFSISIHLYSAQLIFFAFFYGF